MKRQDNRRSFIITIDTEGDNLWNCKTGDEITVQNARYLARFQNLCNKFNFKPVYLTNWEMINSGEFVEFAAKEAEKGNCEIGMHLHAWNTPPLYELFEQQKMAGLPYLIEYPREIMQEKIDTMTHLIYERTGIRPVSHRAGRWAMNQDYYDILMEGGYRVDCSVTPLIDWKSSKGYSEGSVGSDYRKCPQSPYWISESAGNGKLLEVPVTTYKRRIPTRYRGEGLKSFLKTGYSLVDRRVLWLRPRKDNLQEMIKVIQFNRESENDYLMFMLHSSELMPAGSPTFKTEEDIEQLYNNLEIIFSKIVLQYTGVTLQEYCMKY